MIVVIVDDDRTMRDLLRIVFEADGFTVVPYASGADAISAEGDVMVLDLMMPELTGIEVLEQLPSGHMPVLVLTAMGNGEVEAKCRAAGAAKILRKPFAVLDLIHEVRRLAEEATRRWMG
jgi:DNA-binding response OmpR family regulator